MFSKKQITSNAKATKNKNYINLAKMLSESFNQRLRQSNPLKVTISIQTSCV